MKLFGTSGIRAVFTTDLLDLAVKVGHVVGRGHGRVVVGTDTRTSGHAMKWTSPTFIESCGLPFIWNYLLRRLYCRLPRPTRSYEAESGRTAN